MSAESWKLEKDLCRCCHAEGSFHNLSQTRSHLGKEEVYSEMLRSALNIDLSPVSGPLCAKTYTICDGCALRLRDATHFRQQVMTCEEYFKDMYHNVLKTLSPSTNVSIEVKQETLPSCDAVIKVEYPQLDDDDDDNDGFDMQFDDDDDDDDKTVLQMKLEDAKRKAKAKAKPKTKAKKAPKRPRPKKPNADEAGTTGDNEAENPKPKKGKELNQHYTVKEEDGRRVFVCKICEGVFKKRMYFKQHYKNVHLQLRLGSCYICGVKVATHLRAAHLEQFHGIPAPACGICNKKFSFPNQVLRHHKSEHMGEKNYECLTCNMRFPTKDRLKRHEVKHSPVETFVCNYCGKSFKWKKNLFTHIKIHLNDRRYNCTLCGMTFVHRTSLRYHMIKHHPNYPSTSKEEPLEYLARPERDSSSKEPMALIGEKKFGGIDDQ